MVMLSCDIVLGCGVGSDGGDDVLCREIIYYLKNLSNEIILFQVIDH